MTVEEHNRFVKEELEKHRIKQGDPIGSIYTLFKTVVGNSTLFPKKVLDFDQKQWRYPPQTKSKGNRTFDL